MADVDGDCRLDVIWGAGYSSSGSDRLFVADIASSTISWQNIEPDGPMNTFAVGDVDGDGRTEVVRASSESDAGYDGTLLFVTDLHHRRDEYVPTSPMNNTWNGALGMAMLQLDGDPALEYVMNGGTTYDDEVTAFDGITHQQQWTTAPWSMESIQAIQAGDPDGNGGSDIVVGSSTGNVRVLRGSDGALLWQSPSASGTSVRDVRVADVDRDGVNEIVVARGNEGLTVYDGVTHAQEWVQALTNVSCLTVGDFDSDGDPDILAGDDTGKVQVWDGTSKALLGQLTPATDSVWALLVADIDGDGRNELLASYETRTYGISQLAMIDPPTGTILWSSSELIGNAGVASSLYVGDADDDGQNEIIVATQYTLRVWEYDTVNAEGIAPTWPGPVGVQSVTPVGSGCCPALDVSWELANDNLTPPVTYNVYRDTNPTFVPSPGNRIGHEPFRSFRDTRAVLGSTNYYIVRAVDAAGNEDGNLVRVGAYPGNLTISPAALPSGTVGAPYSQTLTPNGGTAPYSFATTGGALPLGLTLSATGTISGVPTTAGSYGFTVTVTDANLCSGSQDFAITIGGASGTPGNIVVGPGFGPPNQNRIRVFRQDGTATTSDFQAYGAGAWGVAASTGFIGASGSTDHIVTGPGPGAVFGPQVRGFLRDGTAIAKVNFYAYGTLRYGVNTATAALDGDAPREMLSGAGPGSVFGPHVRGFNFDGGSLQPIAKISYFAYATLKYGVNVGSGKVDADAFGEILTGPGPGTPFGPQVRGFNYDGTALSSIGKINFNAFSLTQYGVNVGSADSDGDAFDEIGATPGPGPGAAFAPRFVGFNFDGSAISSIVGFDVTLAGGTTYGGRIGMGEVTGDGRAELAWISTAKG